MALHRGGISATYVGNTGAANPRTGHPVADVVRPKCTGAQCNRQPSRAHQLQSAIRPTTNRLCGSGKLPGQRGEDVQSRVYFHCFTRRQVPSGLPACCAKLARGTLHRTEIFAVPVNEPLPLALGRPQPGDIRNCVRRAVAAGTACTAMRLHIAHSDGVYDVRDRQRSKTDWYRQIAAACLWPGGTRMTLSTGPLKLEVWAAEGAGPTPAARRLGQAQLLQQRRWCAISARSNQVDASSV